MLFRVWDNKNNCWVKEPVRIDKNGNAFYREVELRTSWYLLGNSEVEFNTGITLADGTETFFGDIVRLKTPVYKDGKWGATYVYLVLTKDNLFRLGAYIYKDEWSFDNLVEFVGNIHETELTDEMKAQIGE